MLVEQEGFSPEFLLKNGLSSGVIVIGDSSTWNIFFKNAGLNFNKTRPKHTKTRPIPWNILIVSPNAKTPRDVAKRIRERSRTP